jgi:hypothetical protein
VAKHDEMALEDAGAKAADKLAAHEAQHTNYAADMEVGGNNACQFFVWHLRPLFL